MTLLETMISGAMLLLMLALLAYTLKNSEKLFGQSSGRDEAVRQMLLARSALTRDLHNAACGAGQYAQVVAPESIAGAGSDGDALTFLSTDDGQHSAGWNTDVASGEAVLRSQITYWPSVSLRPGPGSIIAQPGPPLAGYDQQNPCKCLVRRRSDCPAIVAGQPAPQIDPGWVGWLVRPQTSTPETEIVARNLLSFRVLRSGGLWIFQLSAVALDEARKQIPLGKVPLAGSKFTLEERFSVVASH